MIDATYCMIMAEYNQWMNHKLYSLCASIPDAERKQDNKAFFKSIHSTLNHIMYGDLAFMSRLTGHPKQVPELGEDIHTNFDDLREARSDLDVRILNWAATVSEDWLGENLTYESKVDGKHRTLPKWVIVTHMFNHETHHRGQITTLLSQMELDIGSTDIPFMPRFQTS